MIVRRALKNSNVVAGGGAIDVSGLLIFLAWVSVGTSRCSAYVQVV